METAVVLPLVILVMLGSIELCEGVQQQVRARTVLHECSKIAARGASTSTDVLDMALALLPQQDVTDFTIQIDAVSRTVNQASVEAPAVTSFTISSDGTVTPGLEDLPRGTLLEMKLDAVRPPSGAGLSKYMGAKIEARCVFVKEI